MSSLADRLTPIVMVLLAAFGAAGCASDAKNSQGNGAGRDGYTLPSYRPDSVEAEGSAAFDNFAKTLKRAALAHQAVHAFRTAQSLKGAERAVAEEFCAFTFMVRANRELRYVDERRYNANRIIHYAAYRTSPEFTTRVQVALKELDGIVDLESLDPRRIRLYQIACYR